MEDGVNVPLFNRSMTKEGGVWCLMRGSVSFLMTLKYGKTKPHTEISP